MKAMSTKVRPPEMQAEIERRVAIYAAQVKKHERIVRWWRKPNDVKAAT